MVRIKRERDTKKRMKYDRMNYDRTIEMKGRMAARVFRQTSVDHSHAYLSGKRTTLTVLAVRL